MLLRLALDGTTTFPGVVCPSSLALRCSSGDEPSHSATHPHPHCCQGSLQSDCRPLHAAPHSEFCFRRWRVQLAEDPASNACCARNTMPYACEPRCSQLRPDHWLPRRLRLHPHSSSAICFRPSSSPSGLPSPSSSPALLSSLFSAFSPRSALFCSALLCYASYFSK